MLAKFLEKCYDRQYEIVLLSSKVKIVTLAKDGGTGLIMAYAYLVEWSLWFHTDGISMTWKRYHWETCAAQRTLNRGTLSKKCMELTICDARFEHGRAVVIDQKHL